MKTLSSILMDVDDLPWDHALYLPKHEAWSAETTGLVLDPDDVDEDEDPEDAIANGLMHALDIQTIQGIVANAREQKDPITANDLVNAYLFYYDNDAYIDFQAT